jgi:hypothetical protein
VWVEPRADNGGLFIDGVDAGTTDMKANMHDVIPRNWFVALYQFQLTVCRNLV